MQTHTSKESSHLLIYFPKCPQELGLGWTQARNLGPSSGLPRAPHRSQCPRYLLLPPPVHISKKLE